MVNMIRYTMILCGVDYVNLLSGMFPAARFEAGIFMDDFSYCTYNNFEELVDEFNTYSALPVSQGNMCVSPGLNNNK